MDSVVPGVPHVLLSLEVDTARLGTPTDRAPTRHRTKTTSFAGTTTPRSTTKVPEFPVTEATVPSFAPAAFIAFADVPTELTDAALPVVIGIIQPVRSMGPLLEQTIAGALKTDPFRMAGARVPYWA